MSDHEWCRDVQRDEQVRAAEDAAAVPAIQHRDLPEAVADLRERVARLEAAVMPNTRDQQPRTKEAAHMSDENERPVASAGSVAERPLGDPEIAVGILKLRVAELEQAIRRLAEQDATLSVCDGNVTVTMDATLTDEAVRAAEDAAAVPAIQHRDLPEIVAELRERLARLEEAQATIGTGDVFRDVQCGSTADEIARLTAERDAAILERRAANEEVEDWSRRCGRILDERDAARARVAELEAAGSARGESNNPHEPESLPEQVAFLMSGPFEKRVFLTREEVYAYRRNLTAIEAASVIFVPLYAAPPPRGWLTAEEREAVEKCLRHFVRQEIDFLERNDPGHRWLEVWRREEAILRALLARETPPRVVQPIPWDESYQRDGQWIAAIRAAGGEVE